MQTNFRVGQHLSMKAAPSHRSVAGLAVSAIDCNSAKHGRVLPSSLGSLGVRCRNFPWEIHCFNILAHFANWADRAKQPLPSSFCVERFRAHGVGFEPTVSPSKGVRQTGVEPATVRFSTERPTGCSWVRKSATASHGPFDSIRPDALPTELL